jgi:hypothetical protein
VGAWQDIAGWDMEGFEGTELNGCDDEGDWSNEGAIEEPNEPERFISGGERSEETERRWAGGGL